MKILITCPPMIKQIKKYEQLFKLNNLDYFCPNFAQVMTEKELILILPNYDGWIIGDDPATRKVFEEGYKGKLRSAVKWGVGLDNVDLDASSKDYQRLLDLNNHIDSLFKDRLNKIHLMGKKK